METTPYSATEFLERYHKAGSNSGKVAIHYEADGFKGLVYYLGTGGRKHKWVNPLNVDIRVTASSIARGHAGAILEPEFESQVFYTDNLPNSWVGIEFIRHRVKPSAYVVAHRARMPRYYLRSWVFEGSNDNENWETLCKHLDDCTLNERLERALFPVFSSPKFYRSFRIRLLDHGNSDDTNALVVSCMEVFGVMEPAEPLANHQAPGLGPQPVLRDSLMRLDGMQGPTHSRRLSVESSNSISSSATSSSNLSKLRDLSDASSVVLLRGIIDVSESDIHVFAKRFGTVEKIEMKPGCMQALVHMDSCDSAQKLMLVGCTNGYTEISGQRVSVKSVNLEKNHFEPKRSPHGPEKRDLPWPTTPTTTPTTTAMANSNGHYPSEVPARRGTTTSLSPITPANPNNAPATQPDEVSNEILLRGVVPEIEHSSIRAFAEAFGTVLEVITKPGLQALLRMDSVDSAAKLLDAHPNNTVMISDTQVTLKSVFTQNSLRGPRAGRPRNSLPAGSLTASMHSGHSEPPPGPKVESPAVLLRGVMGITQEDIHLFASKFGAVQDVVLKPGLQALIYMENVDAAGRLLQECGTSAEIKDTPVQLKSVDLEVAGMGRTPTKSAGEQFPASKAPSDAAEPQTCPLPGLELMQKAAEPHELEPLKHYVDQWLAESLPSADKDPQDGTQEQGPRGEADAMVTGAGQPLLNSTQAPLLPVQPASHAMTTAPSFPPQPSQPVSDAQTVREAASTAASPALDPLAAANAVETKGAPLRQDAEPGSTTITAADVESTPAELGRAQDAARSSTTGVQHAPQPEQTVNRGDSWWGRFTRRLVGSSPTVQAVESASLKVAPPASPPEPQNPSSPSESPQATRVQDATEVPQGQRAGDAMPMQPTGPAEDAGPVESTEHKAVEGGTEPVAADCDDAELEGEGDDTGEHFVFSGLGGDWQ